MILLELCLSPDFGGLEIFFRDYSRWLTERDAAGLHLCVRAGSRLASELKPLGIPTLEFPAKGGALPFAMARRLARYIDLYQVEALHLHWKDDLPVVALAKSLAQRQVRVIHSRHMDLPGPKHDPYHWFLYRSIDTYHTITKAVAVQAMAYLPIPRAKVKHLYLGASIGAPAATDSRATLRARHGLVDTFTVGVVGRISEYKGQHLLVDALWQLRDRGVEVQGVIAGHAMENDYLTSLKGRVSEAELDGRVHFLGFQEDPHSLIRALDVLVLTTEKETFGLVLVEAMLLGVAVIGSDAGGVPEIIQHGRSGLLFDSGDSTALANAIESLHNDPALQTQLARAGQARAQTEFHRDTQYARLLELLQG